MTIDNVDDDDDDDNHRDMYDEDDNGHLCNVICMKLSPSTSSLS